MNTYSVGCNVVNRDRTVKILNGAGFAVDHTMLAACLKKAAYYLCQEGCYEVLLVVGERVPQNAPSYKHPGWIEWQMNISFADNTGLLLVCVQRKPHLEVEFHS